MTKTKLEIAQEYAAKGWAVMPLHTPDANHICSCHHKDCKSNGKHPRTINGLQDATTDLAQIRKWWGMWPEANIGVATGSKSGFVVLDVDAHHGGNDTIRDLVKKNGEFSEKVYAKTGNGGYHILFQHPGGYIPNTQGSETKPSKLGMGLDFRGDGGYIVAPGSTHYSGNTYTWGVPVNGHLPEMPKWLIDMMATPAPATPGVLVHDGEQLIPGDRHKVLLAFAGAMRRKGISTQGILACLRMENANRCNPPKDDAELVKIASYVGAKDPEDDVLRVEGVGYDTGVPDETPGLYTLDEYEPQLDEYRRNGLPQGISPGWNNLRDLYTILPGYLTMVTGSPTAGKSHFMNALMANMMIQHGWKFAVASPEFAPPAYFYSRFMEAYTGSPFYHGPTPRIGDEMYEEAKRILKSSLYFIEAKNGEPLTIPFVMAMAKRAREEYGIQGLTIDPWAKFDHVRPDSMNETDYIRVTINKLQHFLQHENLHGWLVVHPKMTYTPGDIDGPVITPYALPGSAHWYNLAHNIISLYRRKSERSNKVDIHVQKVKPHYIGQEGVCELFYDSVSGQYYESQWKTDGPDDEDESGIPQF